VDGSFLAPDLFGCGINRYLVSLLREWERITAGTPMRTQVLIDSTESIERTGIVQRPGFEMVPCSLMQSRRIWQRLMLMETAQRLNSDLVFMPVPGTVYFKRAKLVITIHDLIPLVFPNEIPGREWRRLQNGYTDALRKADLILTDSHYSKADMIARFGLPAEKVVVAHLGFDSQVFKPARSAGPDPRLGSRYGISREYLLHVGYWQPRKNLERLVRAYRLLRDRRPDFSTQLVLCGRRDAGSELDELARQPALQGDVILTGSVPDADLAALYQNAAGFAMPSLYEGFGLPPLEAMACGIPVMSSDRSSLPEVLGDAAIYFNPESVEDIASALERLCSDSDLRTQLVRRGLERVKQFSWENCARVTLAALQSV
jgi:glycosyltransferase involved in cell wall biosynthesis